MEEVETRLKSALALLVHVEAAATARREIEAALGAFERGLLAHNEAMARWAKLLNYDSPRALS